jgi:hypothetical protein
LTPEDLEQQARAAVYEFSFISSTETVLKTPATLTMRFRITERCFIQLYANTKKEILSYTLVLSGARIFGRDCEGGQWHRHPFENAESHDVTEVGMKAVTFEVFLQEVHDILRVLRLI